MEVKLKINNLNWTVHFVDCPNGINPLDIKDIDEHNLGLTRRSFDIILINKDLPLDLLKRTIDHELVHAYMWSFGLNQFQSFNEENVSDFFETHGRNIIKDSDMVFSKFKGESNGRK